MTGEELADPLLTGEMSLLLLADDESSAVVVFMVICHEGIWGRLGVEGNCFLQRRRGKDV